MVYPALLPLMRTPWLPVVDWTDAPAVLNGLVRFAERRNLVSARLRSHFKRSLPLAKITFLWHMTIEGQTGTRFCCKPAACIFSAEEWWRQQAPPIRWDVSTKLQGAAFRGETFYYRFACLPFLYQSNAQCQGYVSSKDTTLTCFGKNIGQPFSDSTVCQY